MLRILLLTLFSLQAFAVDVSLERKIRQGAFRSKEELLRAMPKIYKSNFVLMEQSNSTVVESSPSLPRLISFDPSDDFILTMGGAHADLDIVEMVEGGGRPRPHVVLFENGNSKFIEEPMKYFRGVPGKDCVKCHTINNDPSETFRYLWIGHYPTWVGAYGLRHMRNLEAFPLSEQEKVKVETQKENLSLLAREALDHPIYSQLDRSKFDYESRVEANSKYNKLLRRYSDERARLELRSSPRFIEYLPALHWVTSATINPNKIDRSSVWDWYNSEGFFKTLSPRDRNGFIGRFPILFNELEAILKTEKDVFSQRFGIRIQSEVDMYRWIVLMYVSQKLNLNIRSWLLNLDPKLLDHDGLYSPLAQLDFSAEMEEYFGHRGRKWNKRSFDDADLEIAEAERSAAIAAGEFLFERGGLCKIRLGEKAQGF